MTTTYNRSSSFQYYTNQTNFDWKQKAASQLRNDISNGGIERGDGRFKDDKICRGNPVNISDGAKTETVTDFIGNGEFPLVVTRNYTNGLTSNWPTESDLNKPIYGGHSENDGALALVID